MADALARRAPEISGKCTVRLRRADEALLAPVVKKALPSADIAVDGSIRLGGVKLETQHILYDETLDFAAAAERAAFLTRCKLRVEYRAPRPSGRAGAQTSMGRCRKSRFFKRFFRTAWN